MSADPAGPPGGGQPLAVGRRTVLAAAAAAPLLTLAGCHAFRGLAAPPKPGPDVAVLRAAIAAEQLMVGRYRVVLADAAPAGRADAASRLTAGQAAELTSLLAQHREHLAQLQARLIEPAGASPSPPRPPRLAAAGVPAEAGAAIGYLQAAEHAAATWLLGQLPLVPGSLAQLLASISASEATHVPVLDTARRLA